MMLVWWLMLLGNDELPRDPSPIQLVGSQSFFCYKGKESIRGRVPTKFEFHSREPIVFVCEICTLPRSPPVM